MIGNRIGGDLYHARAARILGAIAVHCSYYIPPRMHDIQPGRHGAVYIHHGTMQRIRRRIRIRIAAAARGQQAVIIIRRIVKKGVG